MLRILLDASTKDQQPYISTFSNRNSSQHAHKRREEDPKCITQIKHDISYTKKFVSFIHLDGAHIRQLKLINNEKLKQRKSHIHDGDLDTRS